MEENETTETTETTDTTTDTTSTSTETGEGAGTSETSETSETTEAATNEPVIPEGYVKAEEAENERTARTAAEEARTAAETARADAEARATAAEARARATEIKMAAQALNFNDPSDAERFIGADVEDVNAALTEVLKSKPYLAKPETAPPVVTPTSPTNPARTETLTLEAIKGMTQQQVAALPWETVKAVLAQGR